MTRALLALPLLATACFDLEQQPMTAAEFAEAADMLATASRAEAAAGEVVEISTSFTIGAAVEESLENLRAFYESQVPCAEITQVDRTLTMAFGATGETCTWEGEVWTGTQTLTLEQAGDGTLTLLHGWDALSNGVVQLDGAATVVWSEGGTRRDVAHAGTWTLEDVALEVEGERTQTLLDDAAGVAGGIRIDGDRTWLVEGREWGLVHAGVEVKWEDPIPQAGTTLLVTPAGKLLSATYARQDDDTIRLTLENAGRAKAYDISRSGETVEVQ